MRFSSISLCLLLAGTALSIESDDKCSKDVSGSSVCTKAFESLEDMLSSKYWKNVVKGKDTNRAKSTIMWIKDTQSSYFFGESELSGNNTSSSWLSGWKKRKVDLIEVAYGDCKTAEAVDIPISSCISARATGGSVGYSQSNKFGSGLSASVSPSGSFSLTLAGATVSANGGNLGFSFGNGGGVSCSVQPGKRVQVFGTFEYKYFPDAKKRNVQVSGISPKDVISGTWGKFNSDYTQKFQKYGLVFLNVDKIPEYYCVDSEDKIDCNRGGSFTLDEKTGIEALTSIA